MSSARHSRPGKRSRSRRLTAIKKNKLGEPTAIARPEETEEAAFVEYYQAQELLEEEEWPRFMAMLKWPLPVTFRFNRNCSDKTILTSLEGPSTLSIILHCLLTPHSHMQHAARAAARRLHRRRVHARARRVAAL